MKKGLRILLTVSIFILLNIFSSVFAVRNVDVQINGKIIDFTDDVGNKVEAQILNDRTMVPLRKIFEVFGCDVAWEDETKMITATKQDKKIVLKVNDKIATKLENGVEEKIVLDSAPLIVDGRTLVPLRFIAESLDKQVGWDSSSYTAIIIDYDYFSDLIKQKNESLYNILSGKKGNVSFEVTRVYKDFDNSNNNNTATLKGATLQEGNRTNVNLNFSGTNELISEIVSEGWKDIGYDVKYEKDNFLVRTDNSALMKILGIEGQSDGIFMSKDIALEGSLEDDLSSAIKSIFNIDDSKLNVSTFDKMKLDFNKFVNLFVANGTRSLNYDNAKLEVFDYTRFDSIVYNDELSKVLSFINKKIFNYDVTQNEILYDWTKINYIMQCENFELVLKVILQNEYNEEVSYLIIYKIN